MTLPTTEDVNKAREQATQVVGEAMEQARTPLLAALGAGDMAARALLETVNKVREQADSARAEFAGDPIELRKRIDAYAQSAARFYGYLADRGEETLDRIRTTQSEGDTAQERKADAAEEAADLSDDVLGKTKTSKTTKAGSGKSTKTTKAKQSASE